MNNFSFSVHHLFQFRFWHHHHNCHVILRQHATFHRYWITHCLPRSPGQPQHHKYQNRIWWSRQRYDVLSFIKMRPLWQPNTRLRMVLYLVMLLSSKSKIYQILLTYINLWLRYNYFRFRNTNVRNIGIILPLSIYFRFRFWLYHRNRHVILYQLCRLSSKLDTYCGNMTSYQFVKMAAVAAQYYFRFRICWCHCHQKSKIYQQTKFCHHISINGWDITTSGLEKQMSAILEFYFRFRSRPFCLNRRVILHQDAEFSPNRTSHLEIWRHIDFQDGGCQSCCIYIHLYSPKWCLLWGNGGPPTKCFSWSELALG